LGDAEAEILRPEDSAFGDYSTNAALKLAKKERKNPRELAETMAADLQRQSSRIFERIEAAGPGFINFFLSKDFLRKQVAEIIERGANYGALDFGQGKKISIDFISANPTGPVHVGNARGGPLGDVLGNVFEKAGYEVSREYYVNDAGNQVDVLGHSILGDEQAQYSGDYIDDLRKNISAVEPRQAGEAGVKLILEKIIKPSMAKFSIGFDNWISEKELLASGQVDGIINLLKEKKYVYEKDGAWWFRATDFGDDKDRVVIKSSGEKTYFGSDIASHRLRIEQGAQRLIDIWGADHYGDVKRIKGALEASGFKDCLDIVLTQFVKVIKQGQEMKMSKRAGTYVSVDDLIDEAGKDATRFFFLMYSPEAHMIFDLDLAREQSEKNPVYYVQYAFARISSLFEKLKTQSANQQVSFNLSSDAQSLNLLNHQAELDLIKQLIRLPELVADTAKDYQVHRLPRYALDLVRSFHKFYEECRVISEDKDLTEARLALVLATKVVLKNTLDLMGISAPEKM